MRTRLAAGIVLALAICVSTGTPAAAVTTRYQWGAGICAGDAASSLPRAASNQDVVSLDGGADHALWLTGSGDVLIQGTSIQYGNPDGSIGGFCYGTPRPVAGLAGVTKVAAGRGFSLALLPDGTVQAWGANNRGQLGDGTTVTRGVPAPVPSLTGVVDIAAGDNHALAVLGDGSVMAWGANDRGQLGDGTTTPRLTPVSVLGLTTATDVAAGGNHSLAITVDLQVRAWGANDQGQLGDTTTSDRSQPVAVVNRYGDNLTTVVQIDAEAFSSAALTDTLNDADRVYTWGSQQDNRLGNGSTVGIQAHADYITLHSVVQLSVGGGHTVAIRRDGTVYAWGRNTSGQVGNGRTARYEDYTRTRGYFWTAPASAVAAVGDTTLAIP